MLHHQSALTPRAASIIFIFGTIVFLVLSLTAPQGVYTEVERAIMLSLRTNDGATLVGPAWFEYAAAQITALSGWPLMVLFTLLLSGLFLFRRQWDYLAIIVFVTIGQSILVSTFKSLIGRDRPDFLAHLVEVGDKSFPSGHSASAAALYLTLGLMIANMSTEPVMRRYAIISSILLITLIGASRVFLGVHFPTDVIAGFALGSAWASAVWLAAWQITKPS